MKDKKILAFLPARLVKGVNKWYILYYQTNPQTAELERFRPTYNLNRIKNIRLRNRTAKGYVDQINNLLPDGYPFTTDDPQYSSINDALDFFEENKYADICTDAIRPYKRLVIDIKEYVEKKNIKCRIGQFSSLNALGVMNYNKSFTSNHDHLYVFGYALKPSTPQTDKNRMNTRHRKYLKKMYEKELLVSLDGDSLYSC